MIVCSGRSTTCTIQRQQSITQRQRFPSKPPSTQIVCRPDTALPICLTRFRTRAPFTLPHACSSNEHPQHQPQRIHRQIVCVPCQFPTIKPHCATDHCGTLDAMKVDDGFRWARSSPCSTLTHSRRWSCIFTQVPSYACESRYTRLATPESHLAKPANGSPHTRCRKWR